MKTTRCSVDDCDRGGKIVRGVCSMHYKRLRKLGLLPSIVVVVTQCTVDGCDGGTPFVRGMCRKHYWRWRTHGTADLLPRLRASVAERLAAGLERKPNGCLEWTGHANDAGYGMIQIDGKSTGTHRVAWELAHGPIPAGLHVLHHCDNPPCCQTAPTEGYPEGHLFLGTAANNSADRAAKGRNGTNQNVAKTHCPQDHEYTEANTHIDPSGGRHCRACNRINCARYYRAKRSVA